jgi:hypothetical protein
MLLVALLFLSAGCVHMFPPPPTPGPVQPTLLDTSVRPGQGRVYIDVVDGPTNVRVVHQVTVAMKVGDQIYEDTELETDQECRTPCILDAPLGHTLVAFPMRGWRQVEVDDVLVSATPSLYRRALGWGRSGGAGLALGVLGVTFGGCSLGTGAALLPVGLATDKSGLTTSGAITLGVGALLTALGIWAINTHPKLEQPGAGAQYDLTP